MACRTPRAPAHAGEDENLGKFKTQLCLAFATRELPVSRDARRWRDARDAQGTRRRAESGIPRRSRLLSRTSSRLASRPAGGICARPRVAFPMGLPRRWLCVFTKDAHKKYNKRFDDGVLDVDVDDGRIARLYKAEDERPTGEHIARRALTASELEAWLRGDDLSGFEGFDVQVDREVGGEAAGAPAAAASAATTAPAAPPSRRPRGAHGTAPPRWSAARRFDRLRRSPRAASAAARPASRPAADARRRAQASTRRRRQPRPRRRGRRGIGDAMLEAVTRVAGGARGFADLYAEAAPEDLGTGASSSAEYAKANAKANAKAPLAARPSKWEAYDTTAKVAKHSGAPEPRAVPAGGGDEGGLAAALDARAAAGSPLGARAAAGSTPAAVSRPRRPRR